MSGVISKFTSQISNISKANFILKKMNKGRGVAHSQGLIVFLVWNCNCSLQCLVSRTYLSNTSSSEVTFRQIPRLDWVKMVGSFHRKSILCKTLDCQKIEDELRPQHQGHHVNYTTKKLSISSENGRRTYAFVFQFVDDDSKSYFYAS